MTLPHPDTLQYLADVGPCGCAVLMALGDGAVSIHERAARSGCSEREAEEALAKLERAGVVRRASQ